MRGLVNADNSLLYVSDFGSGRVGVYSIDDGKLIEPGVRVGEGPDALAFSHRGDFFWWRMRSLGTLRWCGRGVILLRC